MSQIIYEKDNLKIISLEPVNEIGLVKYGYQLLVDNAFNKSYTLASGEVSQSTIERGKQEAIRILLKAYNL